MVNSESKHMGCSQNYGPFLAVVDYIAAPTNIEGYQNGTLVLGTSHITTTKKRTSQTDDWTHVMTRIAAVVHLGLQAYIKW